MMNDLEYFLAERRFYQSRDLDITDPERTEAFRIGFSDGFISAMTSFGIWKDGKQRIGCQEISVQEIVTMIRSLDQPRTIKGKTDETKNKKTET